MPRCERSIFTLVRVSCRKRTKLGDVMHTPSTSISSSTHSSEQTNYPDEVPGLANPNDARVVSLKVLALSLLKQIEVLESQLTTGDVPPLDLHSEVRRFEVSLIRSALLRTGGRQRRAARLLGMKVTTLNTKIKRLSIDLSSYPNAKP